MGLLQTARWAEEQRRNGAHSTHAPEKVQKCASDFSIAHITSAELDAGDFTVDFLIDGAIPARQPGVIGAPSKSLKTIMAAAGYMAMSTGDTFLGRFAVERPIRCGLVSAESGMAALQRAARAIAAANGRQLCDYKNLLWSSQILDIGNVAHVMALKKWIDGEGLESVALDPAYLMMPNLGDKANNLFDVGSYLVELSHIVAECKCGTNLVHHFRKNIGDPYQEPELEWLAHAGFVNWARWWWLLNRRSKYDPENRGVHQLWLHFGGSAGHSSAWAVDVDEGLQTGHVWETSVRYASEAREEREQASASAKLMKREIEDVAKQTANRLKIERALEAFPAGGTVSDIAAKAKLPFSTAKGVLMDLDDRGVVSSSKVTKANGQKYDGYMQRHPESSECCRSESD